MTRILLGIFLLLLLWVSCKNELQLEDEIDFFEHPRADWITDDRPLPEHDAAFYRDQPAPLFRKTFSTREAVADAKLIVTAAGYYLASINGSPVGQNILDPAWTDFSKRIYYTEYDVTSLLQEGDNCLGISLGNGFYNPLPMRKWGRRNLREDLTVGKPTFLLKLKIIYVSGASEEIISDPTWKYTYGPLVRNSVYLGVTYDAREEIKGWNIASHDDTNWENAVVGESPGGKLQKSFFPPVKITEEINPVNIYATDKGKYVVDMGVNFTGTSRVKISGNTGDTMVFRFGERVYENGTLNPMTSVIGQIKRKGVGGPGAPDVAWQTNSYIIGEDTSAWFQPEFIYHTYRYMEIKGLRQKPNTSDVQGLFLHSNISHPNHFSSSNVLLDEIQRATVRTFRANLVSVQSDCPAREKFGYGGDINATSESFIYNFDMQSFYRKTIYDWIDAMHDTGFVDTAPFVGIQYCGISWESAYLLTQYYLYLYYHDIEIVEEHYEQNKEWMDKVARLHPDGVVESGLSDHESLEPVPVQLTGTCHYLQCARIMSTFAQLMNDPTSEEKYQQLAAKLKQLIKNKFWDQAVEGEINRQTLFATLLYHEVIPTEEVMAAKDSLQSAINDGPAGHFNTGIFGTKYILEAASKYLSPQVVFNIINSTEYPGWGHMIDRGATTIWETWKESDDVYSNCHPMFGTVTEWYYRWLGGIRPDPENPGFKKFFLAPATPDGLEYVKSSYRSPHGLIVSNWKRENENTYQYQLTIPEGTVATVNLPKSSAQEIEVTLKPVHIDLNTIEDLQTGKFTLGGGEYTLKVSSAQKEE